MWPNQLAFLRCILRQMFPSSLAVCGTPWMPQNYHQDVPFFLDSMWYSLNASKLPPRCSLLPWLYVLLLECLKITTKMFPSSLALCGTPWMPQNYHQDVPFFLGSMRYTLNASKLPPNKKQNSTFSPFLCRIRANTATDIILYSRPSPCLQRISVA
jgi:hypothetical protein